MKIQGRYHQIVSFQKKKKNWYVGFHTSHVPGIGPSLQFVNCCFLEAFRGQGFENVTRISSWMFEMFRKVTNGRYDKMRDVGDVLYNPFQFYLSCDPLRWIGSPRKDPVRTGHVQCRGATGRSEGSKDLQSGPVQRWWSCSEVTDVVGPFAFYAMIHFTAHLVQRCRGWTYGVMCWLTLRP